MSWDKNTIYCDEIGYIKNKVISKGILDNVIDDGINSITDIVPIKYAFTKTHFYINIMERHPDCDCDDIVLCKKFSLKKLPKVIYYDIVIYDDKYSYNPEYFNKIKMFNKYYMVEDNQKKYITKEQILKLKKGGKI